MIGVVVRPLSESVFVALSEKQSHFPAKRAECTGVLTWGPASGAQDFSEPRVIWDADPHHHPVNIEICDLEVIGIEYHGYRFVVKQ